MFLSPLRCFAISNPGILIPSTGRCSSRLFSTTKSFPAPFIFQNFKKTLPLSGKIRTR